MKISDRTRASATACATDARGEGARAAAMGATFSWVVGLLMSRDSRVGMPTKFKAHAARARASFAVCRPRRTRSERGGDADIDRANGEIESERVDSTNRVSDLTRARRA